MVEVVSDAKHTGAAMQVKGPGEVVVLGSVVTLFLDGTEVPRSFLLARYDTMGKLCGAIDTYGEFQAYLVGALMDDPSSLLADMPRTRCDGENGVTLYSKGLL